MTSKFIYLPCCSITTSLIKCALERLFHFFISTLIPYKGWLIKVQSYLLNCLCWNLSQYISWMDHCQDKIVECESRALCVCQFRVQLLSSILWSIKKCVFQFSTPSIRLKLLSRWRRNMMFQDISRRYCKHRDSSPQKVLKFVSSFHMICFRNFLSLATPTSASRLPSQVLRTIAPADGHISALLTTDVWKG